MSAGVLLICGAGELAGTGAGSGGGGVLQGYFVSGLVYIEAM